MASHVYLLTRTQTDFGLNLLQLVAEAETFDAGDCVIVEHDSGTHQLRVVGRTSFDHARTPRAWSTTRCCCARDRRRRSRRVASQTEH